MENTNLTNQFLIAMPGLMDGNFSHSVTYICEHDDNGSLGITINRPSDICLGEIFEQLEIDCDDPVITRQPVYIGGPVHQDRGFLLHTPPGNWDSTLKITNHISVTTSRDILEAIARGFGPEQVIIALGYAGWGPGQLEFEMSENAWLSCPSNENILFNTPPEKRWEEAAKLLGIDLQLLSSDTGHA
jgi:putative transcriptional regulator